MRTYLRIFTCATSTDLEAAIEEWKNEQGSMIEVTDEQFSTNSVSEMILESTGYAAREIPGALTTQYHMAISYRLLENETMPENELENVLAAFDRINQNNDK